MLAVLLPLIACAALAAEDSPPPVPAPAPAPAKAPLPVIDPPAHPPAAPEAAIPATPLPDRIKRLDKMSEQDRALLLHEITWERQRVYDALLDRLQKGSNPARCAAAFLLGEYRMDQAAPHLVRVIWLHDDSEQHLVLVDGQWQEQPTDDWFWHRYPAAEALVALGEPAIHYLIDALADEEDPQIRRLCAATIIKIAGERAGELVGDAADAELSTKRKARLVAAVTMFP